MKRGAIVLIAAWGAVAWAATAYHWPSSSQRAQPAARRPNVLLVTLDTVRADHCSAYGYSRPTTPRLERMAHAGVRCGVAYAPMPTTAPSHATMFTGRQPLSHGVRKNGEALRETEHTLAEILGGNGYRTAAVISSYPLHHSLGLAQGFGTYDDRFSVGQQGRAREQPGLGRRADETRTRAVEWLSQNGYLRQPDPGSLESAPFFLWVHFIDPHDPYEAPDEHRALFPARPRATELEQQIAAYDAEIHFADAEMGKILDALGDSGRLADTLTIVTADHGEGLMDHGYMNHGLFLYEEAMRVPLVFHWPGRLPSGGVVEAPVQLVDLMPTVLDLLEVASEAHPPEGRSLKGALAGHEEPERPIFLQRRAFVTEKVRGFRVRGDKSAVRAGKWKYIEAPQENGFELYDLTSDPSEQRNVVQAFPREAEVLAPLLRNWLLTGPTHSDIRQPSQEDLERLRALGYVQ